MRETDYAKSYLTLASNHSYRLMKITPYIFIGGKGVAPTRSLPPLRNYAKYKNTL